MSARNLTLAFFCPKEDEHIINRLVSRVSKYPYCHVELYFESTNQCFSIVYGEKAELRTKTLQSSCYEIVTLTVTLKEYDACLDFCRKISRQNVTFDDLGMYLSWFKIPCLVHRSSDRTFCSKIICEALQSGGVHEVMHRTPGLCTPSRLFQDIVNSKRRVCASVPYKRLDMLKKPMIVFQNKKYIRVSDFY
jgi:hypothetical protein